MNFVRYDPNNKEVVCYGTIDPETMQLSIEAGFPIITVDEYPADFAIHLYDVDPETKALVLSPNPRPDPNAPILPPTVSGIRPISDRQFYQQAAIDGYISQADALAAVQTGFIPGPLQAIVDQISDADEKFNAQMILSGATTFYRDHPLTDQIGAALGMAPEGIDQFFRSAVAL